MTCTLDQIIPKPLLCKSSEGFFEVRESTRIFAPGCSMKAAMLLRTALNKMLITPMEPVCKTEDSALVQTGSIVFRLDSKSAPEAYQIEINKDLFWITGDPAGIFYAIQTLRQMLLTDIIHIFPENTFHLPCCRIDDAPRFPWRGFMLDSARHFQSFETVKALIEKLALYKINRLHWHLSDIYAWRIPLESHPELADQNDEHLYYNRGCYSAEDIREIVALAKDHFMEVIPEIEMPAHSSQVFKHRPDLACPIKKDPYQNEVYELCIGNPDVQSFLKEILADIRRLFPDVSICHLGGDEGNHMIWEACPVCQNTIHEKGLADTAALEADFMRSMTDYARSLGFTPMVWAGCTNYEPDTLIQLWREEHITPSAETPCRMINSLNQWTYLDYPADESEDKFDWMPPLPVEKIYKFDPIPNGLPKEAVSRMIGAEACLWTEKVPEEKLFGKVFPRLCAFSEVVWSPPEERSFSDFRKRMKIHMNSVLLYKERALDREPVSINDIARQAKVSKTSVSLFMNGKAPASKLSTETCARIATTIREHSYSPNIHARTISGKVNHQITLLMPYNMEPETMQKTSAGVTAVLEQNGYRTILAFSEALPGTQLRSISCPPPGEDGCIWFAEAMEDNTDFTTPTLHVVAPRKKISGLVRPDYHAGGRLAADLLHKAGCRKLGILSYNEKQYGAVRLALQSRLDEYQLEWRLFNNASELQSGKCDAVFFDGNRALWQLNGIHNLPDNLPILGTASLQSAALASIRFSIFDFDWENIGKEAANWFFEDTSPKNSNERIVSSGIRNYGKGGFLFEI